MGSRARSSTPPARPALGSLAFEIRDALTHVLLTLAAADDLVQRLLPLLASVLAGVVVVWHDDVAVLATV